MERYINKTFYYTKETKYSAQILKKTFSYMHEYHAVNYAFSLTAFACTHFALFYFSSCKHTYSCL